MAYAPKSPDLSSFYSTDPTTEAPASAPAAQSATAGAQSQQLPSQQSPSQFSRSQDRHLQPLATTYFPSEPTTPGQEQQWRPLEQQSLQPPQSRANKYFPAEPATASPQQKHQQTPLTPQSQRPVGQQQQAYTYSPYLSSPAGQTVSQAVPGYAIPRQPQKAPFYQSYNSPYQPQVPIPPAQFYGHSSATPTTPATSVPPGAPPPPVSGQGQGLSDFDSTAATSTPTSALGSMPPKRGGTAVAGPSSAPAIEPSPVRTKFPTARIKRIMQADEEVGKVAQQTPIAVGKALEMFMVALVTKSADVARERNSKRVSAQMLKQVVESDDQWDFLRDIVSRIENEEKAGAGKGKAAKAESESEEEVLEKKKRGGGRKKRGGAA